MGVEMPLPLMVGGQLGLDDELTLIPELGAPGDGWKSLAGEIDGVDSALALAQANAADAHDDAVATALGKLAAKKHLAKTQSVADRLAVLLDKMPDTVRRLLESIGTFDEAATGQVDLGLERWPRIKRIVSTLLAGRVIGERAA